MIAFRLVNGHRGRGRFRRFPTAVEVPMIPATTSPIRSGFPMLDDWFNYVFTYFPTTNWQHAFSPTIYFGSNIEDAPVEQHVVDQVGSYGYQLNRIIDFLKVAVDDGIVKGKNEREKSVVNNFVTLAEKTDQAAREFKGEVTEESVQRLLQGLRRLRQSDHERYERLVSELRQALRSEALPK